MRMTVSELRDLIEKTLSTVGLPANDARDVADTYVRATLRGVNHHDIGDLPGRLAKLAAKEVNPAPNIRLEHKKAAVETYDGDNGLGELHGVFVMRRAIALAKEYGVGLCGVHNSNHILASSPYVEIAAESGLFGYIVTRGAPTMGAPGRVEKVSGTAPQGFAAPVGEDYPLMFDACIAYTSFGVLSEKAKAGEEIPAYWGLDENGQPTTDPAAVMKGTRLPIAGHKGFGLSILGEILTGILTDGPVIDAPEASTGKTAAPSHTALCIDIGALCGQERFVEHMREMTGRMKARAEGLTLPGERSGRSRAKLLEEGIEVPQALLEKLNAYR